MASYYNRERDAVNTAVFEEYCAKNAAEEINMTLPSATVVLMDQLKVKQVGDTYNPIKSMIFKKRFWEKCGEDDLDRGQSKGRVDSALKLYPDCPVMMTRNDYVKEGRGNRTKAKVK